MTRCWKPCLATGGLALVMTGNPMFGAAACLASYILFTYYEPQASVPQNPHDLHIDTVEEKASQPVTTPPPQCTSVCDLPSPPPDLLAEELARDRTNAIQ